MGNDQQYYEALTSSNESFHSNSSDENSSDIKDSISSPTSTQTQKNINNPHPPVKCKYCPKKYKCGLATHMQKHTNSCVNASELAKTTEKANSQQVNQVNNLELKTKQAIMNNYVNIDKMDRNELLDLEYKFAKAVFASGIPFNAFQNLFWTEFFYALRLSFKIPNNIKLSEATLDLEIKTRLQSENFWSELNTIIKIFKLIIATLKAFEANNSTVSTIYSRFNTILIEVQKIECSYLTKIQQNIQTR
ncbi:17967_t:CDS:2 [Cetraspora pellucida]|uniref:17967_t:CDS:1 n=1 Tax=Cetraspora pellucida TaxID=1433469 RepID=A0ACA9KJ08_9GLOM|nr:17967_t:CDS:2 [Cetraspora pellucida]